MSTHRRRSLTIMGVDGALAAACNLPPGERSDRGAAIRDLLRQALRMDESADGVVVRFGPSDETARSGLEIVLAERRCCPGFHYHLGFEPGSDGFVLAISAPNGLRGPLKALYRGLAAEVEHG